MNLEKPDFEEVLNNFAEGIKAKVVNRKCSVNPVYGKGYCWTETLPSGISIIVSDTCLRETFTMKHPETTDQHYILQFNEEANDDEGVKVKSKRRDEEFQSVVKLSHTLDIDNYVFPSEKRLRSVKIMFNQSHLYSLLRKEEADEMLEKQFPLVMGAKSYDPIATEYRVMLDDLWVSKVDQPLRLNYIQNRSLLLIEKYIIKLHEKKRLNGKKVKRSEDESLRLMKVEALLVKNFAAAPPTIDELSRISAMSPTKLKNDFKAYYGLPIYEYYQKNRMLKAKSLLVQAKYTIREVGQMVGYSNLSHFANTFKKEFGFLPSEIAAKDGVLIYNR